jgi:hypothetical protein
MNLAEKCGSRLILLALAFSLASISCSKPSPGMLELLASREAIRTAQSWQEDIGAQAPTGQWMIINLEKVECPGRMDRIAMLRDSYNRGVHELEYDGAYYSKGNGMEWLKVPGAQIAAITCGRGPSLVWDGVLYDDLDAVQQSGEVRPGKPAISSDDACEWWEVAPAKGAPAHYTVCIHADDHLPYIVHSREHDLNYTYTLSRWNTTKVTLPENLPTGGN